MLVVLGCFLELSRFRASLSRFLTRLSSLSSRFSHSKSFFLFSNRFSASFRRFISFCSRRVRYLRHKNKNITIYNQQQQQKKHKQQETTTKNEQKKNAKRQNKESGAKIKKCIHLFTKANIGAKRYTTFTDTGVVHCPRINHTRTNKVSHFGCSEVNGTC